MIERMLGGRRIEGHTDYEHLAETCNLEDGFIRAYVGMGKKVEGHPVSYCVVCSVFCVQNLFWTCLN